LLIYRTAAEIRSTMTRLAAIEQEESQQMSTLAGHMIFIL
jgi:hypothetical protein